MGHDLVSFLQSEASLVAQVSTFRGKNGEDRGEAEAGEALGQHSWKSW